MLSPREIVSQIFQSHGTRGNKDDISLYPRWPIDLFGSVAYLIQVSDSYTYIVGESEYKVSIDREKLLEIGSCWRDKLLDFDQNHSAYIQRLWNTVIQAASCVSEKTECYPWIEAAINLLIISDVACAGVGFHKPAAAADSLDNSWINIVHNSLNIGFIELDDVIIQNEFDWFLKEKRKAKSRLKKKPRNTSCILINPEILCVQPKTRTPNVGCTLRSLTHHLALLPSCGQIEVNWNNNFLHSDNTRKPFNILFIPFPFSINGKDFIEKGNGKKNVTDILMSPKAG